MLCSVGFGFIKNVLKKSEGNYLEIGIFDGDLISSLAKEFPEKKFYGVDPFIEDGYTELLTNVKKGNSINEQKSKAMKKLSQYKNLKYFIETSEEFYKKIVDYPIDDFNITTVLIDGSHWYKDVIIDTEVSMTLIGNKKGMIIFDDVNVPEVREAYIDFKEKHKTSITQSSVILEVNGQPGITVAYINGGEIYA